VYEVFSQGGAYQGEVRIPLPVTVHEIGTDYILGVARDDVGTEYVIQYRLVRS
jgi:hypothetical protein